MTWMLVLGLILLSMSVDEATIKLIAVGPPTKDAPPADEA